MRPRSQAHYNAQTHSDEFVVELLVSLDKIHVSTGSDRSHTLLGLGDGFGGWERGLGLVARRMVLSILARWVVGLQA